MIEEVLRLIHSGRTDAAVQSVQRDAVPREVARRFDGLVRELYWERKDLPAAIAVGQGGIGYCLARWQESTDAPERDFFGTQAKVIAFNVASFAWPGWDEPGVRPTASEVAAGLDAAKLNLRLAEELNKPAERVQDARWLLGAHLLAVGDAAAALEEFQQSSPGTRPLYAGYVLLAEIMLGSADAKQNFDQLLATMRGEDDEESRSHASQLGTAYRVLANR